MAIHNSQLKRYNGSTWDIYNPKTLASLVGTVAQGGDGYAASRQFVTGAILAKLSLSVNSINSFLTLDSSGLVPINTLPVDLLTGLDAVPYDGTTTDPVNGDLLAYKNGETSYIKQSALSLSNSQVGLGNVDNTSDANKPVSTAQQTALNLKLNASLKGAANGLAELDENRKIVLSQIPDFVLGQMINGGTVNANTAVATLTSNAKSRLGTGLATITLTNNTVAITGYLANENIYYVTSAGGTFAGITFDVGDWLVATASGWGKIDNTDAVSSVAGKTGVVTLTKSDVGLGNVANVDTTNADNITSGTLAAARLPAASASAQGAMSSAYYTKLTNIAENAQVNVLEGLQVNGSDLTITSKKVNVTRTSVGANKTFYGNDAPTGMIEGDLWFDTSA